MDKKTAEKARNLLDTLECLKKIEQVIEDENSHWWAFITPGTKDYNGDGIFMPTVLREEFSDAVDRAISRTESQLEKL